MYPQYSTISGGYYATYPITYIDTKDNYPFYNRWRNNPLSDQSIIRANVAGYYPYTTITKKSVPPPEQDYEYKWQYVGSTIYPVSPTYIKNPEPILFR